MRKLTDSEEIVMKCIWDLGDGVKLSQIVERANEAYHASWKSQTVSTFLSKLVTKEYVEMYREGQYYHYHILVTADDYKKFILADHIKFWNNQNTCDFIVELLGTTEFTAEEVAKLKEKVNTL